MLKIYCTECGNPTTYTSAKPKFCSSCGTPFDKLIVNKVLLQKPTADQPKTPKRILPRLERKAEVEDYDDENDEDFTDVNHVPNIGSLDIELQENPVPKKTKIGDILGSAKSGAKREKIKGKPSTKTDRKKFLEDFKREAGAIRPSSRGRQDG
jgi:hypothetical protein